MTVVAITHAPAELKRYFLAADLERLRAATELRVLGGNGRSQVLPQLGEVDILLGSWGMPRLDAELLAAAPRLRAVCYAAGSVKGFVTAESYARGVLVTSATQANAIPVAEVTVALITLANKAWFQAQREMRQGRGDRERLPHCGNFATTIGLIGMGAIGRLVAAKLRTMEVEVLAFDPHQPRLDGVEPVADLDELARRSDVVSVHAPDLPTTRGMCDRRFFAAMRDGATFINTARGRLVDEAALIAELETGRISAHLDVTHPEPPSPDSPLLRLPNVWLTPHLAGSTGGELRRMGRMAVDECLALAAGRDPRHPIGQEMLATLA
jgi:phosphoglycerate dehydrogenase-like enzyme